jgi:hypothetical protein
MIKNKQHFVNSLWNWDFLSSTLPGKVRISDIDGILRNNGHFLVIETKFPGAEIPIGQTILFDQLVDTGFFTIFILWGKQPQRQPNADPIVEAIQIISPNIKTSIIKSNNKKVQNGITTWYKKVGKY